MGSLTYHGKYLKEYKRHQNQVFDNMIFIATLSKTPYVYLSVLNKKFYLTARRLDHKTFCFKRCGIEIFFYIAEINVALFAKHTKSKKLSIVSWGREGQLKIGISIYNRIYFLLISTHVTIVSCDSINKMFPKPQKRCLDITLFECSMWTLWLFDLFENGNFLEKWKYFLKMAYYYFLKTFWLFVSVEIIVIFCVNNGFKHIVLSSLVYCLVD